MKKIFLVLIGAALILQSQAINIPDNSRDSKKADRQKGSITITSTPDLQNLTNKWAGEYAAINPDVKIQVVLATDPGSNLAFVSTDFDQQAAETPKWKMVIGRDAIVPVINSSNPFLAEINLQGISAADFAKAFENPGSLNWSVMLDGVANTPADICIIDNESIRSTIANFVNLQAGSITGNLFNSGEAMVAAIQKDPNAIGFCKLSDITDKSGQNLISGISLLPIDKNANGKMDYIEKIYNNVNDLSRGIWIGKYPKTLCRNLYAFSPVKPTSENEIAFLKYVLTTGQESLDLSGFNSLSKSERLSKIDRLP